MLVTALIGSFAFQISAISEAVAWTGTDGAVSIYRIDRVPDVKNAVTDTVLSDLDGIDAVTSAGLVVLP